MTFEDAKNYMKNIRIDLMDEIKKGTACQVRDKCVEALDKQIPKKPIFVHPLQNDDCGDFMCIVCKTGSVLNAYGKKSNYCWNCGTKVDWSEE